MNEREQVVYPAGREKKGGEMIDLFMGSGTTGIACVLEGRDFIGIEREQEYIEIAEKRIAHYRLPLLEEE